jgi:hypothetical protein
MRFEHGQDEVVHGVKLDRLFRVRCHSNCAVARRRDAHVSHHRASGNAFQGASNERDFGTRGDIGARLDPLFICNEAALRRMMASYVIYFNIGVRIVA